MPVTPFHFGAGAAIHSIAPRYVSFLAFCAANVLIDVEPLYYMMTGQYPLHRFFHTSVGATIVAALTVVLFLAARRMGRHFSLPDVFGWQGLRLLPVAIGAAAGTYSHLILDGIMHADIRPFAPFSDANPLLGLLDLPTLHWACLISAAFGVAVLGIRRWVGRP